MSIFGISLIRLILYTVIEFTLDQPMVLNIKIYNMLGQEITTLAESKSFGKGLHSMIFDPNGQGLASGMYLVRLASQDGKYRALQKMMYIK